MKEYLLDFLKTAVDADWSRLPNVIFMINLKEELNKQAEDFGWMADSMETTISTVLGHIEVNFSALGMECSEEDEEYLKELAALTATCIWKMYDNIPDDLGYDVFFNQIKGFSLSLT